jgi:DNA replication protein DnaC
MSAAVDREALYTGLKRLKLRHLRERLEAGDLRSELQAFDDPVALIAHLVAQEVAAREATQRQKRYRQANFPQVKTLEDFDFAFQPAANEARLRTLSEGDFITAAENVLFLGPPGVGKTHLATALGVAAVERGHDVRFTSAQDLVDTLYSALADGTFKRQLRRYGRPDMLIIDELGYLNLDRTASDHFFQVINQAYETQAVILTSNRPFQEWADLFDDATVVSAILDRLLHHCHLFNLKGDSYRLQGLKRDQKGVSPVA